MRAIALLILLLASPAFAAPIAVGGQVSGPGSAPLEDASVLLIPIPGMAEAARLEMEGKADPEPVARAIPGADGSFRLEAPEAGMWKVAVQARGMVPRELLLKPLLEETELPVLTLESDAKLEVRVIGLNGKPLAGAGVKAAATDGRSLGPFDEEMRWRVPDRVALTGADGVALLPRGSRERLRVRAGAPGHASAAQDVRGGSASFRLTAGTAREIRVMDAAGRSPVAGVWVQVGDHRWTAGRTAEDGRFTLLLVPGRKEKIVLAAADGRRLESFAAPPAAGEKGPRILRLPALETLSGRVVSTADGRPLAGVLVWSWNLDPGEARRTGADGAYRIAARPDRYTFVQGAAQGFVPAAVLVAVETGRSRGPVLALEPAMTVAGVVVDEQDRPVPGVRVVAAAPPRDLRSPAASRGRASRTSAAGRFRLAGLRAGAGCELSLAKAGFAPASVEVPPLEPGRTGGTGLRLVLRRGGSASGRVLDGPGRPVAGARIELRPVPAGEAQRRLLDQRLLPGRYEADADAAGRFELRGLPAGTYDLTARAPGFGPLTVPGLAVPEPGGSAGAVDLGTVVLAPGVEIAGYVVDPDGRPVPGAEVLLGDPTDPYTRFLLQGGSEPAAVSAQDGFFRVADRRAGETVDLGASRAGYAPAVAAGVQVPPGQPVRLVLQPSAAVEGRTVDPGGEPVAGASVHLQPADPVVLSGGLRVYSSDRSRQADSDESGYFRIEDVIPGAFEVQALAPGYQVTSLENLEVRPGQELKGLQVVLAPAAVISGTVLSPSGQPLAGAEVTLAESPDGLPLGPAVSDGDGRYRLEGIAPGVRAVRAGHASYRRVVRELDVRLGENDLDLRLEGGVEVAGRVVDESGAPVPGARVYLRQGWSIWNLPAATSDAGGSFALRGVADGTYRLLAEKDGFAASREGQELKVEGSPLGGVEVTMSAGGTIAGRLSGLDFDELVLVQVVLDGSLRGGAVAADGSYRIDHVEPGERRVRASLRDGSRQAEGRVTLEPGVPEARLDLDFEGGHTLTGRVLRNGEAARALNVTISGPGMSRQGDTDHQGRFRFEGLEAGSYELQVYAHGSGARHREALEVSADRDVLVELHTVAVSGRVVDAEDQSPIPNAKVVLVAARAEETDPWPTGTSTDSRGVFRLRDVAEGAWKVRALLAGYAPEEVEVQVASGLPVEGLELSLEATEGVVLEVLLASGRPPDSVYVLVLDAAGRVTAAGSYPTGEDGRMRVASIPPGTWELLLDTPASASIALPVTAPGRAGRVILPQPGRLSLEVPGLAGTRVGAKVNLTDASGKPYRVPWGARVMKDFDLHDGSRRFEKLPPGQWTLSVSATDGRTWSGKATVVPGGLAEVTLE